MAKLSAKGVQFVYKDGHKSDVTVVYRVGNCKLSEHDLSTLLELREICITHPVIIDLRKESGQLRQVS